MGTLFKRADAGGRSGNWYAQYIDDQAQFYLPIPLDGASRERIRGNDGDEVVLRARCVPMCGQYASSSTSLPLLPR